MTASDDGVDKTGDGVDKTGDGETGETGDGETDDGETGDGVDKTSGGCNTEDGAFVGAGVATGGVDGDGDVGGEQLV